MKRILLLLVAISALAFATDPMVTLGAFVVDSMYKDTALSDSEFITRSEAVALAGTDATAFHHDTATDSTFNLYLAIVTGDSSFWSVLRGRSSKLTLRDTVL